jgi:hypothetical protein
VDLFLGKTFIIVTDSFHRRITKGKISIIDKEECGFRIVPEINSMETLRSGFELNHSLSCENLEDTPAISTVICDPEFLTQLVKGEDVSNAPGIKVDGCTTKSGFLGSL